MGRSRLACSRLASLSQSPSRLSCQSISHQLKMSHYPPGLQPVPRNPAVLPYKESDSKLSSVDDLVIPESQLITAAKEFVRPELGEHIWNHSHRAFLFG